MLKLFTSEHCPPCKVMKEWLKLKGIEFEEINIDTEEGMREAEKYEIQAVPTLVKDDKIILVGLPISDKNE